MADKIENIWHWQEPGTTWKGIGIYHITITIPTREPLLGTLLIPNNAPKEATIQRTELGDKLVECLLSVPVHHPEVRIVSFCLMPDHLHAIWHVVRPMKVGIRSVVRGFWQATKKIGRAYSMSIAPNGIRVTPDEANTWRDNKDRREEDNGQSENNEYQYDPIFDEKPFIRPLSRRRQLHSMINYVRNNPQRLATKRVLPGFFQVQENIEIAGRNYSGVGNIYLLHSKDFAPVHVRNMWVKDAEQHGNTQPLRNYMNSCILSARKGVVMVSPFISAKEKEVMQILLKEKLPFIVLSDNGFRDYYKPSDTLFDAVAAGLVLILSPWHHDPNKRHISREDCVALNSMAEEICYIPHP